MSAQPGPGVVVGVVEVDVAETAAVIVEVDVTSATPKILERPVVLLGLVLEAAAAAAKLVVFNGTGSAGDRAAALELPANGADTRWLGPGGVFCPAGLSATVGGSPTGASVLVQYVR